MTEMLVITPQGHVVRLSKCTWQYATAVRPWEGMTAASESEKEWLRQEGFVQIVCGQLHLEPNPQLEALCKTIGLV